MHHSRGNITCRCNIYSTLTINALMWISNKRVTQFIETHRSNSKLLSSKSNLVIYLVKPSS